MICDGKGSCNHSPCPHEQKGSKGALTEPHIELGVVTDEEMTLLEIEPDQSDVILRMISEMRARRKEDAKAPGIRMRDLEPLTEDGGDCHMTWEEFRLACLNNAFTDYDGIGDLATASEVSDISVYPSEVVMEGYEKPKWATHIVWYNK